tara:strand:- start:9383 stop:10042 length:660 start_codon:yes stop_codon:yes gene_type:complete
MSAAVIIQARMSSKRLPNKVLKSINGKPLLEYIIEQIQYKNNKLPIIVATSKEDSDKKIVDYCNKNNILYHCGDLLNVSSRYVEIIKKHNLDFFVRICADSPLLDGNIVKKAVSLIGNDIDIITNVHPRTFPKGQSVEVVNSNLFCENFKKFKTKDHFEHVTKFFYENDHNFKIINIKNNVNTSNQNLCVDSSDDFKNIKKIIFNMTKPHFEYSFKDLT